MIISLYLEDPVYLYYATSYLLTAFNSSAFSSAKEIRNILDRARTSEVNDDLAQQGHQWGERKTTVTTSVTAQHTCLQRAILQLLLNSQASAEKRERKTEGGSQMTPGILSSSNRVLFPCKSDAMLFLISGSTFASAKQETRVWSLGWEDPREKGMLPTPVFLPGASHR